MRGIIGELRNVEWLSVVRRTANAAVVQQDEFDDATRSMKDGSQSALVAPKPFKTRSGRAASGSVINELSAIDLNCANQLTKHRRQ